MEQYEERLQILFNQLIDNETLDKSIWNRLFLITIQYDVLYHTDICSIFRTDLIKVIKEDCKRSFCSIYVNLLHHCAQLQLVLKVVLERLLQNSRGYIKDETLYSVFTNNLFQLTSEKFWLEPKNYCYCISNTNIVSQFFIMLSTFFIETPNVENSNDSNSFTSHSIEIGPEEENFWFHLVHSKEQFQMRRFFQFLKDCFVLFEPVPTACLCSCHKNIWRAKFVSIDGDDDKRLESELKELENQVLPQSIHDEFHVNTSPVLNKLSLNNNVVHDGVDDDDDATESVTSEWSIKSSNCSKFEKIEEYLPQGSTIVNNTSVYLKENFTEMTSGKHKETSFQVLLSNGKTIHMKRDLTPKVVEFVNVNQKNNDFNEDITDDGKTESAIESIPFDEPGVGSAQPQLGLNSFVDIPLLKFDDPDNIDEWDEILTNDNHIVNNNDAREVVSLDSDVEKQFINRSVSPFPFVNTISVLIQTEEKQLNSTRTESASLSVAYQEETHEDKIVEEKIVDKCDQITQTISATKNHYIGTPNEDHYILVENMNNIEIQNVFKLAQTFSTIC